MLRAAIPATNQQPVRVWVSDESRFGIKTIMRRRITLRGVKPVGIHQHAFGATWIYGAVEPMSGASHFMELPHLNAAMMQRFVDALAAANADRFNLILVDNARSHTAKALVLPANVGFVFQPPYSPEVNPCERVWQAIKTTIAWEIFADLDALRAQLVAVFRSITTAQLQSLTQYPYIVTAVNALSP